MEEISGVSYIFNQKFVISSIGAHVWHMLTMEHTLLSATHMFIHVLRAPYGPWGCKNRPDLFPGQMLYEATRAGLGSYVYFMLWYLFVY